jgi:hypothetical protein
MNFMNTTSKYSSRKPGAQGYSLRGDPTGALRCDYKKWRMEQRFLLGQKINYDEGKEGNNCNNNHCIHKRVHAALIDMPHS